MSRFLALLMAVAALVLVPSSAQAACQRQDTVHYVQGVAQISTHLVCTGQTGAATEVVSLPLRDSGWDAVCVAEALSIGIPPENYCDRPSDATAPSLTPALVASAFRRLPLPASVLQVQPPNGRTLVNFETNFYTDDDAFTRTVNLLGQRVELRIWPARFGWRFGDGASTSTTGGGSPYPDLDVTHRYLSKGRVAPSVDTTYAARFRVGNGPWRDVDGTVTIPGQAQGLRVVEARPVLVGG